MNSSDRSEKIARYGSAHSLLTKALARFPREMWRFRPTEADWSIHEIVVHITDSEANGYVRARKLIAEPGSSLMAYDENTWARKLGYHQMATEDALELFRRLRGNSYRLIRDLPESVWAHSVHHPESGRITLDDWLDTYTRHVPNHIRQMEDVYTAWS